MRRPGPPRSAARGAHRPLRFTDADGHRLTAFATNTVRGQLPDLELRHRRRARAEDRIRTCKATGLTNLSFHGFVHNRIWVAIVALAVELTAWTQMLALTGHEARRWEPKRLRLRLFSVAGRIARHVRRVHLRAHRHHHRAVEPGGTRPTTGHLGHSEHLREDTQQPPVTVSSQAVTHTKDPG